MQKKTVVLMWLTVGILGSICQAGVNVGPRVVLATFYPIRLALINLTAGVAGVEVISLATPETGCLHDYQLTTRDMALLTKAEVMVVNGAGLEAFLDGVVHSRPGLKVIDASAGIDLLVSGGVTNAHVWVSPVRHIRQIHNIADGLAGWDPGHAAQYQANAALYIARLERLKKKMDAALRQVRRRDIITFHEAFPYFADDFKLKIAGVIEREPGSSPSAAEMVSLIERVRSSGVKTIFVEPQYPAKVAQSIARETGAGIFTLDPVVSGPDSPDAYIRIMEQNIAELERALR